MIDSEYQPQYVYFSNKPWIKVIERAEKKTCSAYCALFSGRYIEEEDKALKNVWKYFARITSFRTRPDAIECGAFGEEIDALDDAEIELTKQLILDLDDAELKSRMADIVWSRQRKGNFTYVKIAVEAYLESAQRLEDMENWFEGEQRIERACQLAYSIKNKELMAKTLGYVNDLLVRCNGEDPYYLSARLMKILIDHREGDPKRYAPLAQKLAESAEAAEQHHKAREHWDIVASWYQLDGNPEKLRSAMINAAETYVKEAERRREQPFAPYMHAASNIGFAIEAYRKITGTQERIKELHHVLLDYQRKSTAEYQRFDPGPIDLSEVADQARKKVEGKSLYDALFAFATLLSPTKVAATRERAQQLAKEFVFSSVIPSTRVNALGRTIARHSGLIDSSLEDAERSLLFKMFELASQSWQLHAQGVIEPARQQIESENNLRVRDFEALVHNNPFVPDGRQLLYARGLHAGMTGDFLMAAHLLIPQVEHSIRHIVYQNELIASGYDSEGLQREFDLNTTLKDSRYATVLRNIFGEDTLFDLQGILVEAAGANLRNDMAHGLLEDNQFYSFTVRYFWWLILRLCCMPIIIQLQAASHNKRPENSE